MVRLTGGPNCTGDKRLQVIITGSPDGTGRNGYITSLGLGVARRPGPGRERRFSKSIAITKSHHAIRHGGHRAGGEAGAQRESSGESATIKQLHGRVTRQRPRPRPRPLRGGGARADALLAGAGLRRGRAARRGAPPLRPPRGPLPRRLRRPPRALRPLPRSVRLRPLDCVCVLELRLSLSLAAPAPRAGCCCREGQSDRGAHRLRGLLGVADGHPPGHDRRHPKGQRRPGEGRQRRRQVPPLRLPRRPRQGAPFSIHIHLDRLVLRFLIRSGRHFGGYLEVPVTGNFQLKFSSRAPTNLPFLI